MEHLRSGGGKAGKATYGLAAIMISCFAPLSPAAANPITESFVFTEAGVTQATGSFTYASTDTGPITYADLSAFTLTIAATGGTYNLAFVDAATDYVYFDFDPASQSFVPGTSAGFDGPFEGLLSATSGAGVSGFFFDPLPSMNVPNNDGEYTDYAAGFSAYADTVTFSVPEPASAAVLVFALGMVGYARRRRVKVSA